MTSTTLWERRVSQRFREGRPSVARDDWALARPWSRARWLRTKSEAGHSRKISTKGLNFPELITTKVRFETRSTTATWRTMHVWLPPNEVREFSTRLAPRLLADARADEKASHHFDADRRRFREPDEKRRRPLKGKCRFLGTQSCSLSEKIAQFLPSRSAWNLAQLLFGYFFPKVSRRFFFLRREPTDK